MGSATQPVAYGKWGAEPLGANRTIEGVGCYITSWAMLLDYWGGRYNFHTNPYELNRWLKDNGGYSGNDLNMGAAARYAKAKTGRKFYEARSYKKSEANDRLIDRLLDDGIPVILEVSGHFVIAVGKTSINGVRTWYINDPLRGNPGSATSLYATLQQGYSNQYISLRWGWEAPSDTFYTYRGPCDAPGSRSCRRRPTARLHCHRPTGASHGPRPTHRSHLRRDPWRLPRLRVDRYRR
jgi:hypothetical protein